MTANEAQVPCTCTNHTPCKPSTIANQSKPKPIPPPKPNTPESIGLRNPMPFLWYPTENSVKQIQYVRRIENEFSYLQKAFLTMTTNYARMQFRIRQLTRATPYERHTLLKELEKLAFQDADHVDPEELPRIQRDLQCMGDIRRKQNCIMSHLHNQLVSLSEASELEGIEELTTGYPAEEQPREEGIRVDMKLILKPKVTDYGNDPTMQNSNGASPSSYQQVPTQTAATSMTGMKNMNVKESGVDKKNINPNERDVVHIPCPKKDPQGYHKAMTSTKMPFSPKDMEAMCPCKPDDGRSTVPEGNDGGMTQGYGGGMPPGYGGGMPPGFYGEMPPGYGGGMPPGYGGGMPPFYPNAGVNPYPLSGGMPPGYPNAGGMPLDYANMGGIPPGYPNVGGMPPGYSNIGGILPGVPYISDGMPPGYPSSSAPPNAESDEKAHNARGVNDRQSPNATQDGKKPPCKCINCPDCAQPESDSDVDA